MADAAEEKQQESIVFSPGTDAEELSTYTDVTLFHLFLADGSRELKWVGTQAEDQPKLGVVVEHGAVSLGVLGNEAQVAINGSDVHLESERGVVMVVIWFTLIQSSSHSIKNVSPSSEVHFQHVCTILSPGLLTAAVLRLYFVLNFVLPRLQAKKTLR